MPLKIYGNASKWATAPGRSKNRLLRTTLPYFEAGPSVFASHSAIAAVAAGDTVFPLIVAYSSTLPAVAGTNRWLTVGTLMTSTAALRLRARAAVAKTSA